MTDNQFITVTRTLVTRAWADIEPKVQWAFASGVAASFVIQALSAYGVKLPGIIEAELPFAFAMLAGYLAPSVGTTISHPEGEKRVQESTSGNSVSVITASTPVQTPRFTEVIAEPAPAPAAPTPENPDSGKYGHYLRNLNGTGDVDNAATKKIETAPTVQVPPADNPFRGY